MPGTTVPLASPDSSTSRRGQPSHGDHPQVGGNPDVGHPQVATVFDREGIQSRSRRDGPTPADRDLIGSLHLRRSLAALSMCPS